MNMLRMCLDRRVLVGLAGVGVALFLVAPDLAIGALPFLIVAACPLSMAVMAIGMRTPEHQATAGAAAPEVMETLRTRLAKLDAERATLVTTIAERSDAEAAAEGSLSTAALPQRR